MDFLFISFSFKKNPALDKNVGDFLKVIRSSTIILVFVLQGNSVAVENFSKKKEKKEEKRSFSSSCAFGVYSSQVHTQCRNRLERDLLVEASRLEKCTQHAKPSRNQRNLLCCALLCCFF